jgi:nucleotide-binding universal stress UspA family protein
MGLQPLEAGPMSNLENVKTVLIALYEDGEDSRSSALGYGLSLARAAGAHANLQAASVKLDVPSTPISSVLAEYVVAENQRIHRVAERIATDARRDGALSGLICETSAPQLTYLQLQERTLAQARVSDVVVADASTGVVTVEGDLLRTLLFESGRPTIVVPAGHDAFACRRIIVAWDGSQAAARAVAAAMPYLRAADEVAIVACVEDKELAVSTPGVDLAAALVRHGVTLTVKELNAGPSAADRLREQTSLFRADMLVMGAFVHSPFRQWLFGGVTQAMLKNPPVPLLMAH